MWMTQPLFTLERIWVLRKKRKERGDGQARGEGGNEGTDTSLITSFLSVFFFHESPLSKQQQTEGEV